MITLMITWRWLEDDLMITWRRVAQSSVFAVPLDYYVCNREAIYRNPESASVVFLLILPRLFSVSCSTFDILARALHVTDFREDASRYSVESSRTRQHQRASKSSLFVVPESFNLIDVQHLGVVSIAFIGKARMFTGMHQTTPWMCRKCMRLWTPYFRQVHV